MTADRSNHPFDLMVLPLPQRNLYPRQTILYALNLEHRRLAQRSVRQRQPFCKTLGRAEFEPPLDKRGIDLVHQRTGVPPSVSRSSAGVTLYAGSRMISPFTAARPARIIAPTSFLLPQPSEDSALSKRSFAIRIPPSTLDKYRVTLFRKLHNRFGEKNEKIADRLVQFRHFFVFHNFTNQKGAFPVLFPKKAPFLIFQHYSCWF